MTAFEDTRRTVRRYAATLMMRAVAGARRARLLPYARRVSADMHATTMRTSDVPGCARATKLWAFRDGGLLADEGIVVLPGKGVVAESAKAPWAFDRRGVLPLRPLPSAPLGVSRVATVTIPALRRSWGHWILDVMPRLYLLDVVFVERGLCIAIGDRVRGNYLEALLAYLPADYRIVEARPGVLACCDEIVLPGYLPVAQTGTLPPPVLAWLTRLAPRTTATRKLYIPRAAGLDRAMSNEPAIRELLEQHGFETVYPEKLSFADQVQLFASARVVAGTHGSGLTGIMYMPPGGAVFEFFPSSAPDACPRYNQRLAESVGLHYASMHGAARQRRDSFAIAPSDLTVALERFARA